MEPPLEQPSVDNPTQTSRHTGETEHLNKIRAILFGEQIANQNQRFDQLEKQLMATCDELRNETTQRLETLEHRLMERLEAVSQHLAQTSSDWQSQIDVVNQTLTTSIEHQTLAAKEDLETQIQAMADQLKAEVNNQKLNDDAQRVHLATLFGEISKKLSESQP